MPGNEGLVERVFRAWAPLYDARPVQWALFRRVHRAMERSIDALALSPRAICDVGCGTGLFTEDLARRHPGAQVVGLDLSAGMLAEARRHRPRSLQLVRGSVYDLPFPDASFDLLTNSISMHWYRDRERALAELCRVLRPGGFLIAAVPTSPLALPRLAVRLDSATQTARQLGAAGFRVMPPSWLLPGVTLFRAQRPGRDPRA